MEHICYNCFCDSLNEAGVCTRCGYDGAKNREKFPQALSQGAILYGRYIVGRVLGQGGFGITYLAQDYQTKELVAIKEFFPDTMATRTGGTTVTPFSGERGENFAYGRDTFLEEAKTMAEFLDNPNIVRVHSYFEENGTGYFVMEYLDGVSFQQYIKDHGGRISWEETLKIMLPILDALSAMHAKGIIHRDVTPDNIFITKDGTVKLLDFGAARYSLGNVSRSLDVILKHGFAPKEQYKRHGRQGPYTDVYSTAATIYYAITGTKPDDAIERSDEDTMPLPTTLGTRITEAQEKVLLKGLAVQPEDRYQTIDAFRDALSGAVPPAPAPDPEERRKLPKWLLPACGAVALILIAVGLSMAIGSRGNDLSSDQQVMAPPMETVAPDEAGMEILSGSIQKLETTQPQFETFVMMSTDSFVEDDLTPIWGQSDFIRRQVEAVSFERTKAGAPEDAWDVSAEGDGSIVAWMDARTLHIGADGIIALNPEPGAMFMYFSNVKTIDFGPGVDTSAVTSMRELFSDCVSLTELDVSGFDTSQVTDMTGMFSMCASLTELDVSGFDTSQVTSMMRVFSGCASLTELDISGFDTSRVTRMDYLFYECAGLKKLDIGGIDTSRVTDMDSMFSGCTNLMALDMSGFDTSLVTDMSSMFRNCQQLTSLNLGHFDTCQVTDMSNMFYGCQKLTELDVSGFDTIQVTNMHSMFSGCAELRSLDLSGFDTAQMTDMGSAFYKCYNLTRLNLSGFRTSSGTNTILFFCDCESLTNLICTDDKLLAEYEKR